MGVCVSLRLTNSFLCYAQISYVSWVTLRVYIFFLLITPHSQSHTIVAIVAHSLLLACLCKVSASHLACSTDPPATTTQLRLPAFRLLYGAGKCVRECVCNAGECVLGYYFDRSAIRFVVHAQSFGVAAAVAGAAGSLNFLRPCVGRCVCVRTLMSLHASKYAPAIELYGFCWPGARDARVCDSFCECVCACVCVCVAGCYSRGNVGIVRRAARSRTDRSLGSCCLTLARRRRFD